MRGKCGIDAIATPPDPHRHTVSRLIANKVGASRRSSRAPSPMAAATTGPQHSRPKRRAPSVPSGCTSHTVYPSAPGMSLVPSASPHLATKVLAYATPPSARSAAETLGACTRSLAMMRSSSVRVRKR